MKVVTTLRGTEGPLVQVHAVHRNGRNNAVDDADVTRYSGSSSARSPRSALLNWLGHVAEPAEPVALLSSRSAERFNLNPLRLIRRPANDKDAHDRHRDLQCNGKAVSPLINSTKGLDVTPEPGSSTRSR
jgi:hypothetical protein